MDINVKDNVITFTKTLKAPQKLAFSMFKNPHITRWWGSPGMPIDISEQDFRPGGTWHFRMSGPDGAESWSKVLYDEIDEPNKIVWRDYFSDADGNLDKTKPSSISTITLTPDGDNTILTIRGEYESAEILNGLVAMGFTKAVEGASEQLDKILEELQ